MLNSGDESISRRLMLQHDKKRAAFTLAETLITLTILGVVAAITVPSLINKQIESANRTKVKKAMAVYEKALNQMIIDQDAKGSIKDVTGFDNTCSESTKYFKKVQETTPCKFKTADRVWWDITDIEKPIIAFKDTDLTAENAADATTNKAFYLIGRRADGILRINDKGYEDSITSGNDARVAAMLKLYNFINNVIENGNNNSNSPLSYSDVEDYLTVYANYMKTQCTSTKQSCIEFTDNSHYNFNIYDDKGTLIPASDTGCHYEQYETDYYYCNMPVSKRDYETFLDKDFEKTISDSGYRMHAITKGYEYDGSSVSSYSDDYEIDIRPEDPNDPYKDGFYIYYNKNSKTYRCDANESCLQICENIKLAGYTCSS